VNRRNAIKNVLALSALSVAGFSGYKYYSRFKKANIKEIYNYKNLIAELAETIIPQTDTPGAKQANVQDFIINIITNCSSVPEQNTFLDGLDDVQDYCQSNFQKEFVNCSSKQKIDVLQYFEEKSLYKIGILNKINQKLLGQPFFVKLKALTVIGYCNSLQGATEGLAYDYIPGAYQACIPIQPNQKSWATK